MPHVHHDLGFQEAGSIVVVSLANRANVRLLDSANYQRYRSGGSYSCHGGQAVTSPVRLSIPHAGHWYVALDLGGAAGTIRSSVEVLRQAA